MSGAASLSAARRRRAGGAQMPPPNAPSNNNVGARTQQQQKQPQQKQNKNINPLQLLSIHHIRLNKIELYLKRFEPLLEYYESLSVVPEEKVIKTVTFTEDSNDETLNTPVQVLSSHNKRLNEIEGFISRFEKLLISQSLQTLSVDNLILHIKEKTQTQTDNKLSTKDVFASLDADNF